MAWRHSEAGARAPGEAPEGSGNEVPGGEEAGREGRGDAEDAGEQRAAAS